MVDRKPPVRTSASRRGRPLLDPDTVRLAGSVEAPATLAQALGDA